MILPVSAVFACVCTILLVLLSVRVAMFRLRHKKGVGVTDNRDFEAAVRAQANLTEYAPIAVILLAIGELNGVMVEWIYALGMAFVLGRFLHAWGMIQGRGGAHPARLGGILLTWLALLAMVVAVMLNVFQANY
ncbi:MAPEG family protein [Marinobacter sp. CA1]|uniref:MAPEG family protein n=1 Tax=Marinobacter sp. CA1 TaxID=2817656 RepID=UPI001D08EEA6|nr:MAPEG family protein [Marinobacter sp. CA1]MCG8517385.1 MAPEG family protein [Pseudomonadales bacterium]UDL04719.1 MAPEG family protein [Marinobacter sp. CA1]